MIREAFDSKKNDAKNVKKSLRRFRENLRVRLTRVFELAACHGCFAGSPTARVENGRLAPEFEEFIDSVRSVQGLLGGSHNSAKGRFDQSVLYVHTYMYMHMYVCVYNTYFSLDVSMTEDNTN